MQIFCKRRLWAVMLSGIMAIGMACSMSGCQAHTISDTSPDLTQSPESSSSPTQLPDGTPGMTGTTATETPASTTSITTSTPTPTPTPTPIPTPTQLPQAGINTDLKRDGTPKKYFTLSFDDGTTQDLRIIEILKKYNMDCATFNINTGLYGVNWKWVGENINMPELTHIRFTEAELRSGIYDGFDVEVHTLTHPGLAAYDGNRSAVVREVKVDGENIADITGIRPVGMAWPGGAPGYTDNVISYILEDTEIRFARTVSKTLSFRLPEYFMAWNPTIDICNSRLSELAQSFLSAECTEDMLFYVWGHGYELDVHDKWDEFEAFIKMMSEATDVVFVTNAEFYQLFKDEIPSWK